MPTRRSHDFTAQQAQDLARYFLGLDWVAWQQNAMCYLGKERGRIHFGDSWRTAFRAAGVQLPYRIRFASVGRRILRGSDQVAICISSSFAERVSNALNAYEPGPKGK